MALSDNFLNVPRGTFFFHFRKLRSIVSRGTFAQHHTPIAIKRNKIVSRGTSQTAPIYSVPGFHKPQFIICIY